MRELFDFLRDYGLTSSSDLDAVQGWDDRHYRRFCEELGDLLDHPSLEPQAAKGLVLVPDEWRYPHLNLTALCLYADTIVVPAVVLEVARNHGEMSIQEVQMHRSADIVPPGLKQLMDARALVEERIVRLARRAPEHGQYSALAQDLLEPLRLETTAELIDDRHAQLLVGALHFPFGLYRGPPSRGQVEGPLMPLDPADFTPTAVQATLQSDETVLGHFFGDMVHHLTWEILSQVELASSVDGHPMWLRTQPWGFLRLTLGMSDYDLASGEFRVHAAALELLEQLPFLDGVPVETVAHLREEYEPQLHRFRAAMSAMATSIASTPDAGRRQTEAQRIVREEINPAIAQIVLDLQSATRTKKRYTNAALGVASLGVVGAFLTGEPIVAGLAATTIPFIQKAIEAGSQQDRVLHHPLFFLWKLKEGSA